MVVGKNGFVTCGRLSDSLETDVFNLIHSDIQRLSGAPGRKAVLALGLIGTGHIFDTLVNPINRFTHLVERTLLFQPYHHHHHHHP